MGSCCMPTPASPALLKDVLSVPPMARLLEATAPATPRSAKGSRALRTIVGGRGRSENARAADPAGARIDIEIAIELGEFGLGIFEGAEVLLHVRLRTEQSLLLAGPQRDADGAPRLEPESLDEARGFHHDRRADGVVGGAGGGVPRIEVAAEHDDLVRPCRCRGSRRRRCSWSCPSG